MTDLFASDTKADSLTRPLADRLRPGNLDDVVGQDHLTGPGKPLRRMQAARSVPSLVFWGPPGTGKTTLARLLSDIADLDFVQTSAILSGVADLRKIFADAEHRRRAGRSTLLFVDEIHRFNRAQQDSFLPHVEDGTIVLVGATTENPSFELNGALLSRMQVLTVNRLTDDSLERLLSRAEQVWGRPLPLDPDARVHLRSMADGDGRFLLNSAEAIFRLGGEGPLDTAAVGDLLLKRAPAYDKDRDGHYNLISALHKSLRASDVDAALYWLARMLVAGEEPHYILRRLVRFASEDVGLADPQALTQALAAKDAFDFLGSPEGELAIVQATLYLATAPKSNAAYAAERAAKALARKTGSLSPPPHSLNAPTQLMKDLGYSAGYKYDHAQDGGFSGQSHFPEDLPRQALYEPVERGFEREIAKRLSYWAKLRDKAGEPG